MGLQDIALNLDVADDFSDLFIYDPGAMTWTDLSSAVSGSRPSPRNGHASTFLGSKLYVQGGFNTSGKYFDATVSLSCVVGSQGCLGVKNQNMLRVPLVTCNLYCHKLTTAVFKKKKSDSNYQ